MGYLTTHVLDTARGCPARGMRLSLYRLDGDTRQALGEFVTNEDGRCDGPLLEGEAFRVGEYELLFEAGEYLDRQDEVPPTGPRFLARIPLRFGIDDAGAHYHVPLLLSPFGYSTYRGS
ncbi:hydroxyisourate hydrolase [Chromohalobacter beijerinckii]|jgi:5-hydroxyisourate hydrolase|uniref:5-hydroxyisourate hydrolase n=3 Tax=Chromohalobacter TaxID=42054 RepID=Q1R1H6_CHRI1|nr:MULTISPECIES: hydroxyisourate hydrolase [Chromohalobacter]ABE57432.1 Transthyretin [Chromohalobacter salexigens DSM 3043]MCK0766944.1 hydroxyisourate hydrolase [Chromohalobacter beijerinckii]MCT8505527.1 hydroxyisourate hydrolase [Chromohalobacter moromii]MDO0945427.1 hydroxyisourate hydrolase [Chromohalobacter salexigens]NQY45532.1 hydroxyisourate hydrolase [Chromohalobacter sp.]